MADEQNFSLTPIHFFAISCDCKKLSNQEAVPTASSFSLPSTSGLCDEYPFAKVAIGWHEEGLGFYIQAKQPCTKSTYPDVTKGDSVELMIDTRDLKSVGFNTRFCHHFYFLPKEVDEHQKGEITRFRTEDSHVLCDPELLKMKVTAGSHGYTMQVFIPTECLHGYDPRQFDRLGFTYRINRAAGAPQHFSVSSNEFNIDQQPSLWASLKLNRDL